jgi:primase-polymerase (primpol)-like protein
MISASAEVLSVRPENIPKELRIRPQWVNWRLEKRDEKPTKVPYTPRKRQRASISDLMTWGTFEDAFAVLGGGGFDGVGFVFCSADPFVGVDIDECRDPATGEVEESARMILDSFAKPVLVEVSPSGTGMHIIVRGRQREGRRKGNVEIYGQDRFFTVTGVKL